MSHSRGKRGERVIVVVHVDLEKVKLLLFSENRVVIDSFIPTISAIFRDPSYGAIIIRIDEIAIKDVILINSIR